MRIATTPRDRHARQLRTFLRYVSGLRRFLRTPLDGEQCRRRIRWQLENREATFVALLQRAVFENPGSPYRPLFDHAGIELGDVLERLADSGLSGALEALHEAGVYIRLDELKGLAPIERPGLSYDVRPEQFDNPLLDPVYQTRSGGSVGARRAVQLDFASTEHEASYTWLFHESQGAWGRPNAMWWPVPPGGAGLAQTLWLNKVGVPVDRWFTQTWPSGGLSAVGERAIVRYTQLASRRWGPGIRGLERVPLRDARRVARWLADAVVAGTPAVLNAPASSAVRIALVAAEASLDLSGTLVHAGGEPLTAAKAGVITDAGCRATSSYAMSETGRAGVACATPSAPDDVHLLSDKLGVIQRRPVGRPAGGPDGALWLSSLHLRARKVLINAEVGDYGTLEDRECGCAAGALGLTLHLHGIRSHEKLTVEGMTFLGNELVTLVEHILPRRFGGAVGDYQLVESERDGRSRVSIVVSERVGAIDDRAVAGAVLAHLRRGPSYRRMMASLLDDGDSLTVARGEPHVTVAAKVPALHFARTGSST